MSKLNAYSESFKVGYEKFLIGCDAQEEMDGWDTETDGEMEGYYSNILVSVVMKLMASDGVFTEKEVEYFNKVFGFTYSVEELDFVYENCADAIEEDFCKEIEEAVDKLENVNEELANAFKELLGLIGNIISASDGVADTAEIRLMKMVEMYI